MVLGSNLYFLDVNSDVVHGRGFESLLFGGQWWCSAWSCGRISRFLGVNGGVVHGHGFESLAFVGHWWRVHGRGFELTFGGPDDHGVVHGRRFESLGQWWCSAWSWVQIFHFFWSMVV
jgi:hypothetical protein